MNIIKQHFFKYIFLFLFLGFFYIIYYFFRRLRKKNNYIINYLEYIYLNLYYKPLKELNDYLVENWHFYGDFQEIFSNFLYWLYKNNLKNIFIFIFIILPRIIIIIVFLVELFLTGNLYYTLYCLLLLILPIFVKLFLFLSFDFINNNYENFKKYADIKFIGGEELENYEGYSFILKDILPYDENEVLNLEKFKLSLELIIPKIPIWMDLKGSIDKLNKYLILIWFSIILIVFLIILLLKLNYIII